MGNKRICDKLLTRSAAALLALFAMLAATAPAARTAYVDAVPSASLRVTWGGFFLLGTTEGP